MNSELEITVIAEHSVALGLLPENAAVLDLGCRGFKFSDVMQLLYRFEVFPVDIGELDTKRTYSRLAISDRSGRCGISHEVDPQATHIKSGNEIEMLTLEDFSKRVGVDHWHLIKMDIEGSEYGVLQTAKHPIADQVSVEFHEHTPRGIGKEKLDELLDWLSQWYDIYNRVWEERHGAGFNYWDVLMVAK